jgi:hypothetical protein
MIERKPPNFTGIFANCAMCKEVKRLRRWNRILLAQVAITAFIMLPRTIEIISGLFD